jgi:cobalamin-dependent methionine synthase I
MLQLVTAMAVPLGAAIFTSGLQQNVEGLLLALGGASLFMLGRQREPVAKAEKPVAVKKASKRMSFMEELRKEKKEAEYAKQTDQRLSAAQQRQQKQQDRLRRLQARWSQQEVRQKKSEGPPEPLMYAAE